ncbi:MAG: AMP-binding protein [Myxococcales bacterium]
MAADSISDPYRLDLRVIQETLRSGRATEVWLESWLPSTHTAPERFQDMLRSFVATRRDAPVKGRDDHGFDLYHDLVAAHVGRKRVAFVAYDESGSVVPTSYDALQTRSNGLAAAWTEAGVEVGQVVAIVAPVSVDYLAALVTAFRLGLVAAPVALAGPALVRSRLLALQPHWVTASARQRSAIPLSYAALPLSAPPRVSGPSTSHAYDADQVALRLLSPFAPPSNALSDLTAKTVHDSALRDGALVFALRSDDVLAAPGFDVSQHQPALLLGSLACGAAFAELAPASLAEDPVEKAIEKAVDKTGVTVLGLTGASRELLLGRSVDLLRSPVRAWFRSLTEVLEGDRWDALYRLGPAKRIPGFAVVSCAASGGVLLASPPTSEAPSLRMWPVPGLPWQLSESVEGAVPALAGAGIFTLLVGEDADPSVPRVAFSRSGSALLYGGSLEVGRDAQRYPIEQLEEAACTHPEVRHAAAIAVGGRHINDARVVLLAFTEGLRGERPIPLRELEEIILRELGERFRPDRIEVFPLRPRIQKTGAIDRAWCRSQYLGGVMSRKARSEIFVSLGRLGYLFEKH